MSKENYIEETSPHESAYKHVSRYAEYTDDINEPKNTSNFFCISRILKPLKEHHYCLGSKEFNQPLLDPI